MFFFTYLSIPTITFQQINHKVTNFMEMFQSIIKKSPVFHFFA